VAFPHFFFSGQLAQGLSPLNALARSLREKYAEKSPIKKNAAVQNVLETEGMKATETALKASAVITLTKSKKQPPLVENKCNNPC